MNWYMIKSQLLLCVIAWFQLWCEHATYQLLLLVQTGWQPMGTRPTKSEPIRYFFSLLILQMVAGEKCIFLLNWKIRCGNQVLRIGLQWLWAGATDWKLPAHLYYMPCVYLLVSCVFEIYFCSSSKSVTNFYITKLNFVCKMWIFCASLAIVLCSFIALVEILLTKI